MLISMFEASAPSFIRTLRALDTILAKAQAYAEAKKIVPAVLLGARLYPDMFDLTRQVQIATDHAKGAMGRLAGVEVPMYEDSEHSFEELRERIRRTLSYVEAFVPEQLAGSEDREFTFKAGPRELTFKGLPYLTSFALPNFYFHVVTAYDILRHNGVEVGKKDFLGA